MCEMHYYRWRVHPDRGIHDNGRPRDENNPKTKLTAEKVSEIRKLAKAGMTQARLGEMYGVNQSSISSIMLGRTWQHVTDPEEVTHNADSARAWSAQVIDDPRDGNGDGAPRTWREEQGYSREPGRAPEDEETS